MIQRAENAIRGALWRLNNRLTGAAFSRLERRLDSIDNQMSEIRKENRAIMSLLGQMHDREQTERLARAASDRPTRTAR